MAVSSSSVTYASDEDFENFAVGNGINYYQPNGGCLSPTASCNSASITIATYNVLGKSHKSYNWKKRADKVVENITEKDVTVVGFQELEPDQRSYIKNALSNFKQTSWGKTSETIMWNADFYDQVDKGTWVTTYFGGPINEPWVKLRDKASQREFYVMNVHDPINRGKGSPETRLKNVKAHIELIKKLQSQAPVLFTGDFNTGYDKADGNGAASDNDIAYCMLTKDGFMNHVYDLWKKRAVKCPNKTDPKDGMPIVDHIFVSPGVSVSDLAVTGRGDEASGSDHKAVIANITLDGNCGSFTGEIKVAQANIKTNQYAAALNEVTQDNPDFISLNEVHGASRASITPEGYALYRDESAKGEEKSTAVLWKSSRWSKVEAGRVEMVKDGPQKWDAGRSFSWVTLKDTSSSATASMISLHHMINPKNHGPNKPKRQELYKKGLEKLVTKVKELSSLGPVIVAGDFNSQYTQNDPWGPRKILSTIGMKPTFDEMGPVATTHDGKGILDYIFYTADMKAVDQSTRVSTTSDHRFLFAKLQSASLEPTAAKVTSSPISCICKDPSILDANGAAAIETPDLKAFIREYIGYAVKANEAYGIPYEANLAQGYLESGSGQSLLAKKYFNFHGLKAGSSWDGPVIDLKTQEEYTPGKTETITDGFRVFRNAKAGWLGYAEFITGNDRYEEALKYPGDPYRYLQAIKDAGYATDSQYVNKVSKIIDAVVSYVKEADLASPSSEVEVSGGGSPTGAADVSSDCSENTGAGNATDIIRVAKEELGKSPVEYDENVLKYTTNRRESWCADFVSWVYKQAGSPFTGGNDGWQIPSVITMQEWFKKNGHYFEVGKEKPQPGDVAFYIGKQTPDGGRTSHVNIVIEVDGGKMTTIGGNESNAVKQSIRTISLGSESLVGFGRMK